MCRFVQIGLQEFAALSAMLSSWFGADEMTKHSLQFVANHKITCVGSRWLNKNPILEANAPKFWFRVVCRLALAAAALFGSETSKRFEWEYSAWKGCFGSF